MQRIMAILLAAVGLGVVAGCGSSDSSTSTASAPPAAGGATTAAGDAPAAPTQKAYKLTLVQGVRGDQFYISMQCGADEAAKAAGSTLDVQGPAEFDASLQTPIVNSVIAKKPDAMLIAPTDSTAMIGPLKQAQAAGIKVVLVDTTVKDPSIGVSRIASDNIEGGKEAAKALAQQIGESGKVLLVNVKPGISTTDERGQGFEEGLKAYPNIQYLGQQYSNNDPAKAASIVSAALAKDPDLKGIFATNLFAAEGSATGLKGAGKQGAVKIIGFDAGPPQVKDLKDGTVQGLVVQKPLEIGADGVQQALNSLNGQPVEKEISTGFVVATKDNLTDPEISKYLYKDSCG